MKAPIFLEAVTWGRTTKMTMQRTNGRVLCNNQIQYLGLVPPDTDTLKCHAGTNK